MDRLEAKRPMLRSPGVGVLHLDSVQRAPRPVGPVAKGMTHEPQPLCKWIKKKKKPLASNSPTKS
jgi:hypothetical protein